MFSYSDVCMSLLFSSPLDFIYISNSHFVYKKYIVKTIDAILKYK